MMRFEDRRNARWIHLDGELDSDGCAEMGDQFRAAVASGPDAVVVDMTQVTFVASHGIRLLLQANRKLREAGRSLRIAGLSPRIRRVFETTGLFEAIPEYDA
jgi:anti-anti-sigma factor